MTERQRQRRKTGRERSRERQRERGRERERERFHVGNRKGMYIAITTQEKCFLSFLYLFFRSQTIVHFVFV